MSSRSVARSAIRPPIAVKTSTNWATAAVHGAEQLLAALDPGGHGLTEPLVPCQPGAGGQHLGGRAAGPSRLVGEPVGDRLRGGVELRQRGVLVGVAASPYAATAAGETSWATRTTGP